MTEDTTWWPAEPETAPDRVAVVTVSYNTRELTAFLLWSLHRVVSWPDLEIVVVDNGSRDGSAQLLAGAARAGACVLVRNDVNRQIWQPGRGAFTDGGDPSLGLLASAGGLGLRQAAFPFTAGGYIIHRGRGSLAAVFAAGERDHPLYQWAAGHHEPHFAEVPGADQQYQALLEQFRRETGELTGASLAAACLHQPGGR